MKLLSFIFLIAVWFVCVAVCASFLVDWIVGDADAVTLLYALPVLLLQFYTMNEILTWDNKT